jgi:hypothetical protein
VARVDIVVSRGATRLEGANSQTRSWRAPWRRDQHRGQKGGDGIGYSGYKHQKGEKVLVLTDNNGYVLSLLPVAPVNTTDMVLLPEGLKALKKVAKEVGLPCLPLHTCADMPVTAVSMAARTPPAPRAGALVSPTLTRVAGIRHK